MRMASRRNSLSSSGSVWVLQVEHDLQAMFDLPQEGVVVLQKRSLLHGQAANVFQLRDGLQRVAGADLRQIAAVEQLQELDHEFDVANATVAGLDVAMILALPRGSAVRCGV